MNRPDVQRAEREGAQSELGPGLPPKAQVWSQARELRALAERAMEFAGNGPTADLALALRQFDSMRAVLGCDMPKGGAG